MAAPQKDIADILVLTPEDAAPEPPALEIGEAATVGMKLAAARKAKGLNHVDVHSGTKIKIVHIAAIEAGERQFLPATPFTAGFVKAYAQFLGLDGEAFAKAYKTETGFQPIAAPVLAPAPDEEALAQPAPKMSGAVFSSATSAPKGIDAEKLVTWLGVGAVIATVAFFAGRALQLNETASPIASAPAAAPVIVAAIEPPAPVAPVVAEPEPVAEIVDQEPVAAPEPIASVKPPVVKPKPKPAVIEAPPAPVEVTPPAIIFTISQEPAAPAVAEPALAPAIEPARVTRAAAPEYPERCAARASASVGVSVIFSITTEGRPVAASVAASDDRCFNSAALRAVYDMRFSPRKIDGAAAIETGKTVTVQFVR